MTEEELLTEFINELDCNYQPDDFREFVRGTLAFKRFKLTHEWTNVKDDLYAELQKLFDLG